MGKKRLEDYLLKTEKDCQKMMKATKPEGTLNAYHRGRYCTVCEIRELIGGKQDGKFTGKEMY